MADTILIIDFGSQVTQLIARRVRETGVYCEIIPFQSAEEGFKRLNPKAVIFSGGPASVMDEGSPRAPQTVFDSGVPILAICYGQQTLCHQLGGTVEGGHHREFGRADVEIKKASPLFEGFWGVGNQYTVWMSHGDRVTVLPDGFEVIGTSPNAPFAIAADESRKYYTTMFHPEVVHTPEGAQLLSNFVLKIAGVTGDWSMSAYREQAVQKIRDQVGPEGRVLCALSGGVDSSVAALLIHEAIGQRLTCVQIIGGLFIDVFEKHAKSIGGAKFLAQGTLYPDVIESVSFSGGPSVTIKSHHNVGGLPERMNMQLVEPLRELFKDEVRVLGKELGLPDSFIGRHPFPGPGLAIRCPGGISRDKLDILRQADAIYIDEIRKAGLYDVIWQAFAVLLPVQTVGVMGDGRTYEFVCALRAVTSVDGMTADFHHYDMEFLGRTATRIINEVRGINRVVYDVTSKPPGTIEWE